MKLAEYAKQMGVRYETAWRWFRDGKIQGQRIGPHTIIITEGARPPGEGEPQRVAIYARVSSHEHQANLDRQAERLIGYCAAKGYQVNKVVKEIASGVNDSRPKLLSLLEDQSMTLIVVEQKDRLTRFGFRYLDTLLKSQGRSIEVVNLFAFRATEPDYLLKASDPTGPKNDGSIERAIVRCDLHICAWGAHSMAERRASRVSQLIRSHRPAEHKGASRALPQPDRPRRHQRHHRHRHQCASLQV